MGDAALAAHTDVAELSHGQNARCRQIIQQDLLDASYEGKECAMNLSETNYQAYLLRLWRDGPHNRWRASLQSTKAGDIQLFADVQSLLNFLQSQTDETTSKGDDKDQGDH